MNHVRQKHRKGCVVACLAMVTGLSYDEVLSGFHGNREEDGLSLHGCDVFLGELGYAMMPKYNHYSPLQADRVEWPPAPFAPAHIIDTVTPGYSHAVVMDADGVILDPNKDAPAKVSDYLFRVVFGIFKVRDAFPRSPLVGLHWSHGKGKCTWCGADSESYNYHDHCPGRKELFTPGPTI